MNAREGGAAAVEPEWASWPDEKLLDLRFCDLQMSIVNSALQTRIDQLYRELKQIGIRFKPYFWLSTEWFTPDGVPGCAAAFYLVHPRLAELEQSQIGEVEGGTDEWCMRILRHEAGHAIDNAYQLRRRRRRQELFGSSKTPYPEFYEPRPYSRSFVVHLEPSYAQSHPDEDFAETFAVWMTPHSAWQERYAKWPVLKKLEYMDKVMAAIRDQPPLNGKRRMVEPLHELDKTLREHYRERRESLGPAAHDARDRDLKHLFPNRVENPTGPGSADRFIAKVAVEALAKTTRWTGEYKYMVKQVIEEVRERCRTLRLGVDPEASDTRENFLLFLTAQTMKYVLQGRHRQWL